MRRTLIIAAAISLLAAGVASAHARLLMAAPKAGETVAASPKALVLTFSEDIDLSKSSVTVTGPGDAAVVTGKLSLDPKNKHLVTVPLSAPLAPGAYGVAWKMSTPDTHTTDGKYAFTVKP